ncbi:MAG: hypothetical protein P8100_06855 [bacterium]
MEDNTHAFKLVPLQGIFKILDKTKMRSFKTSGAIVSVLFLLIGISNASCVRRDSFPVGKVAFCDAETLSKNGKIFVDTTGEKEKFQNGHLQTDLAAFGGNHSAMTIPGKSPFAMKYTIRHAGPDWYFKVSVWRKSKDGKGALVASAKDAGQFYMATSEAVDHRGDWEKLQLEVYTPPTFFNEEISIYVWNNGSDTAYFDDLRIARLQRKEYPVYEGEYLAIVFDTTDYIQIMENRRKAFAKGILQTEEDSWVKGLVSGGEELMKARIRLKGDWLDHLWGTKWSFRIKMRKQFAWNRLRVFSVQTPVAREYLREWEAHKLFEWYDLLTTRYGFIPLFINNESRGLYAWEEHFDKQLLEWRYRREGPILKFTEDVFWQMQRNNLNYDDKWRTLPYFEASVIMPFKDGKTLSSSTLYGQFMNGQKLMYQYKHRLRKPEEIFDIRKMAGYYALSDVLKISHGMVWHNQRMYFNPVLCKLEPIAFDAYGDHREFESGIEINSAYVALHPGELVNAEDAMYFELFKDSLFLNYYLEALEQMTDPLNVKAFKESVRSDLSYYDSLLLIEFPRYEYDKDFIVRNAAEIRTYLPELKTMALEIISGGGPKINVRKQDYSDTLLPDNTASLLVHAYLENKADSGLLLRVNNFNPQPVILLGTGKGDKYIDYFFHPEPEMEAFIGDKEVKMEVTADTASAFLFYMVKGRFETYRIPIFMWPYPSGQTAQQEIMKYVDLEHHPLIERMDGRNVHIKRGVSMTDRPLVIPAGYAVYFSKGTSIDFINQSMFVSYSPVFMEGSPEEPVIITSSDFSAQGFTVLQADERSMLNHVQFNNLNTLDHKGWMLTGAVTFYESDVDIRHTTFYRNQCEDALNTIRSEFIVDKCRFEYIFGDAFDSDFCKGEVLNTAFVDVGNDAIDFSGSRIHIRDVLIDRANDKGISGGEESFLNVENTIIKKCAIGLASKDLSSVEFRDGELRDCKYGLVLLQKKPEYGPATIIFNRSSIIQPETEMVIEKGSKVVIDGKVIEGQKEKLAKVFYE